MNAVVKSENNQVVSIPGVQAENLIAKAIENNVPVETLERLLAMRATLKAEQAREAFFSALSAFQAECPIIKKEREVKNKGSSEVRYRYANLEDIVTTAGPHLKNNGLSYTIKAEFREGFIQASCIAHHVLGHSEESTFVIPIAADSFMNDAQKSGSALTYAKRYAFCNAFGIMTGDHDDDGQASGAGKTAEDLYRNFSFLTKAIYEHHESIQTIKEAIETGYFEPGAAAWFELDEDAKKTLWAAPTKGGIFTTHEREIMKTEKWRLAYYKE